MKNNQKFFQRIKTLISKYFKPSNVLCALFVAIIKYAYIWFIYKIMGNCKSIRKNKLIKTVSTVPTNFGENQLFIFHVSVGKLKLRDIPSSLVKSKPLSVSLKVSEHCLEFSENLGLSDIYQWDSKYKFMYKASLSEMDDQKLEILVMREKKIICSTEIKIKSIIDGPVHQNIVLTKNGLATGRVSFETEFLEVSNLLILAENIECQLNDDNVGFFSVSIKFMSDSIIESQHSKVSENPTWSIFSEDTPSLGFPVTMESIRDAALQIRLYKHHRTKFELAAECWIGFTKLFAKDIETIYRKQSFLEYNTTDSVKINYDMIMKAMNREHSIKINEGLWLCGRKVGNVIGKLKISGMPTFVQLISGVNTENGIVIKNTWISDKKNKKNNKNLPEDIIQIQSLMKKLKKSIQSKSSNVGPAYERTLFEEKKKIIDDLCDLLLKTTKESMICFNYGSAKSLMKSQGILIDLSNHLIEYAPLVNYDIKPYYFRCITLLINRGELDLGYLSSIPSLTKDMVKNKLEIAASYVRMLQSLVTLSLSRMVFKGIDKLTQEYVDKSLAICWFRVPELRDCIKELVKKKSYYNIEEWRNIETNIDDESKYDILNPLDWETFFELIPENLKNEAFTHEINKIEWRSRIEKRGVAFFSFFEEWVEHAHKQTTSEFFIWSNINGYKILFKAFLIEMKEREIIEYPEALISCACKILYNTKMLNIIVRIIFSKTNVYDFNTVQETFIILDKLFTAYFKLSNRLPTTFDVVYFTLGLKICLENDNALNIARCLWFIYNHYHMLQGNLRKELIYDLIARKYFKKYFFHWSKEIRNAFHYLILYRIKSLKKIRFEYDDGNSDIFSKIQLKIKEKIKNLKLESLHKSQIPYFNTSINECSALKEQWKKWKNEIPTVSGKLYGHSDEFPYPVVNIKLNFMDLTERKLEEQW